MTTVESTGAMILPLRSKFRERDTRSVPGVDAVSWDWTPILGFTAPALRDAVTMFSGALDDLGRGVRISIVKGFNGQMDVLGTTLCLDPPISYIGVPAATEDIDEMSDILDAFEHVRAEFGLTQREMFSATGIKKRTYHSWKRKPLGSRPRVASQGRFWRLVDAVEEIRDTVDRPLDQWIRGDHRRLGALLDGRFDDLLDLAVNRPAYRNRSIGTSVYTGIAEDIDMPIIRTGKANIEDVGDGYRP